MKVFGARIVAPRASRTAASVTRTPNRSIAQPTGTQNAAPTSVQVGPERSLAAAKLSSGAVVRLSAAVPEPEVLDTRADLVDPTIDRLGIVWSVPRSAPGAVRAHLPGGDVVEVADAWAEATSIAGMALSRDGTRIAATVTSGGRSMLWVAGVLRNADGVPEALGTQVRLVSVGGTGLGVTWIDDVTVGVLGGGETESVVVEQVVGAPTTTSTAAAGMKSIAGGSGISSLRLLALDGTLFVKRGTTWQPTATGIRVLATQQGAPQ